MCESCVCENGRVLGGRTRALSWPIKRALSESPLPFQQRAEREPGTAVVHRRRRDARLAADAAITLANRPPFLSPSQPTAFPSPLARDPFIL